MGKFKDYLLKDGRRVGIRPIGTKKEQKWVIKDLDKDLIVRSSALPLQQGKGAHEKAQEALDNAVENKLGIFKGAIALGKIPPPPLPPPPPPHPMPLPPPKVKKTVKKKTVKKDTAKKTVKKNPVQ